MQLDPELEDGHDDPCYALDEIIVDSLTKTFLSC